MPGERTVRQVMDSGDITRALTRIAHEIVERNRGAGSVLVVGIHRRGVPLARRIGVILEGIESAPVPVGSLDISPYRDDLDLRTTPSHGATDIPVEVDGRTVVLVDDVLFTGRTIRAALDGIVDHGRPAAVQLAALIDRGHRELPVRPDYIGKNVPTALKERVAVQVAEIDGEEGVWIESSGAVPLA
jgi:pyrimidine operon attenuation protein/uracil phosphoribosyltransferase